ncbi:MULTISPECIES: sugar porter family MFS transporter [unclassified Spirosoma]|uniref:sugar porter family MFS transporter n=1 Tax=unclassified Spirosoma TaxID=2621999 RepID=UPI00095CA6D7|nr:MULTISPECIES: sugar porter family MFS transporter [unclassified Spirosoma]MBN8825683.1 sugar porter family MFS transporter [Spirosoma sp.]OJW76622.1 MAG: MFS transporter [Spirosoma sp. 48-14]
MPLIIQAKQRLASSPIPINQTYVYLLSAVAALGGVLFGFDLVIISGTLPFFPRHFGLSEAQIGWAVGCINLGAAIGALLGGKLSEVWGRRALLMACALLFALTGPGTGWAENFSSFIVFRLASGVAIGAAALVCPMYIAEITPASLRGRLVSFYQLSIVMGILLAYLSNYLLLNTGNNNWRWMFSVQAIPALLFVAGLFFIAESPRWLMQKGKDRQALAVLAQIGGQTYAQAVAQQIRGSFVQVSPLSVRALFTHEFRPFLRLGVLVALFSQAVGQNSLFSYAPELFRQAGMGQDSAFFQSIGIGLINLLFTFIAIHRIETSGRKQLLIYGAGLLSVDALALAVAFYGHLPAIWVLLFVLAFIAIYSATLGPVTWVILSEIFPNRIRAGAMAVATLSLWVTNFLATASFPILKSTLGLPVTFGIHAAICLIYFLFLKTAMTETKGKSLEEIDELFTRQKRFKA